MTRNQYSRVYAVRM